MPYALVVAVDETTAFRVPRKTWARKGAPHVALRDHALAPVSLTPVFTAAGRILLIQVIFRGLGRFLRSLPVHPMLVYAATATGWQTSITWRALMERVSTAVAGIRMELRLPSDYPAVIICDNHATHLPPFLRDATGRSAFFNAHHIIPKLTVPNRSPWENPGDQAVNRMVKTDIHNELTMALVTKAENARQGGVPLSPITAEEYRQIIIRGVLCFAARVTQLQLRGAFTASIGLTYPEP